MNKCVARAGDRWGGGRGCTREERASSTLSARVCVCARATTRDVQRGRTKTIKMIPSSPPRQSSERLDAARARAREFLVLSPPSRSPLPSLHRPDVAERSGSGLNRTKWRGESAGGVGYVRGGRGCVGSAARDVRRHTRCGCMCKCAIYTSHCANVERLEMRIHYVHAIPPPCLLLYTYTGLALKITI